MPSGIVGFFVMIGILVKALLILLFTAVVTLWPLWLVLGFFWLLFRFVRSHKDKDE